MQQILLAIIPTIIGAAFGVIGYLVATFWFRPVLRYKDIKYQIAFDLTFFANAIDRGVNSNANDRMEENRRRASELRAIYDYLPKWYKKLLEMRKEYPNNAYPELIGLGNTEKQEEADKRINNIKKYLKLS